MNGNTLAPAYSTVLNETVDWSQQMLPRDKWICGPSCKHKTRNAWAVKEIPKRMTVWSQKEKKFMIQKYIVKLQWATQILSSWTCLIWFINSINYLVRLPESKCLSVSATGFKIKVLSSLKKKKDGF